MAQKFLDLTSQITGSNSAFTIAPDKYEPGSSMLVLNGAVQRPEVDYNENSDQQTLTTTFTPLLTDKLSVYYEEVVVVTLPSGFTTAMLQSDYLFGLDLKDQMGRTLPDQVLANKITIAIARMERELRDFAITPKVIKCTGWEGGDFGTADIFEDPYDYDLNDYMNWGFLVLRRKPVISVQRIRLIYPTGQLIIQYPLEWIKIYHKFAQIQIVPMAGSFSQYPLIGQGAMYLPLMSGFLTKSVPQLIHVDYTAGLSVVPADLTDAIYKMAAIDILRNAGQSKAPGVASLSTSGDGLSENTTLTQSANTTLYGAQIKEYQADVKQFIVDFLENQKGIDFRVA
jgi:hypothetical protein